MLEFITFLLLTIQVIGILSIIYFLDLMRKYRYKYLGLALCIGMLTILFSLSTIIMGLRFIFGGIV